jgi:hypothetical protein
MPRHSVCLVHGHDAELLSQGVVLKCSEHKHIDRRTAQLMVSGTGIRPFLDPDYNPLKSADQRISEPYKSTADWALVPHVECSGFGCKDCQNSGKVSSEKYLVVFSARCWQVINGSQQYAVLGSARQSRKRGRTHLRNKSLMRNGKPEQNGNVMTQRCGDRAGFRVSARGIDTTRKPSELAMQVCRPSLLRRHQQQQDSETVAS